MLVLSLTRRTNSNEEYIMLVSSLKEDKIQNAICLEHDGK